MRLEVFHVAERVHADAAANHADDDRHKQREAVDVQAVLHLDAMSEHQLEHERTYHLHHGEDACERVFVLHAEVQDHAGNHHAYDGAYRIDRSRREFNLQPRRSQVGHNQPNGADADDDSRRAHDHAPRRFVARHQKHAGDKQREQDKEPDQCHAASPFRLSSTIAHSARNEASCGARTSDTVGHFSIAGW